MIEIDLFSLIPDDLKKRSRNALVDFVSSQAEKFINDEASEKIKKLRSDYAFGQKFEKSVKRGAEIFVQEYQLEDEDLVAAIAENEEILSKKEVQDALLDIIKNPETYLVDEQDIVVASFEAILPERHNRERVDRAISHLLRCIAKEASKLPEVRPVYEFLYQRVQAETSQQSLKVQEAQLLALQELQNDFRGALPYLVEQDEKKLLKGSTATSSPTRNKPYHNLPRPDYKRFVGREDELLWLKNRLSPSDRAWQIAVTGIGGVGKSALAIKAAYEYVENYDAFPEEERFDAIIWVSAKEEVLTAHGTEKADLPELVFRNLEDVYIAIARTLDHENITRALPSEQAHLVEKALKEQRTLLVMDNLESVTDDRIKPFLRNLPSPTKAIITSREWLDVADVWTLKGMALDDAYVFMDDETDARLIDLSTEQKKRIYDLTSGLPLPIKLAVARISGGESFSAVERWLGNAAGDLPEYCIKGQANLARQYSENTWKLLLACSLFSRDTGASRDALGYIADLSLADRDDGLSRLQRLFLINRMDNDRFWVLPIVQRYAQGAYRDNSYGELIVDHWLSWLSEYAQEYGVDLEWEFNIDEEISAEYPNILEALRWAQKEKRWDFVYQLGEGVWPYLHIMGLYNELADVLNAANDAVANLNNPLGQARIDLAKAKLALVRGKQDEMQKFLKSAEQTTIEHDEPILLGEIWSYYLVTLLLNEQFDETEELGLRLYKKGEEIDSPRLAFYGAYRLSSLETFRHNFSQATKWIEIAETWAKKAKSERTYSEIMYRKGVIASNTGNLALAEEYLLKALELNASRGEKRYVATDKYQLALIYKRMENLEAAKEQATEAVELFARLGMPSYEKNTNILLGEIDKKLKPED